MQTQTAPPKDSAPPKRKGGALWLLWWYLEWALPGLGMFSVAYIIFAVGSVAQFQQAIWPSCYLFYQDCNTALSVEQNADMVKHLSSYIQICGIMAGMLLWGVLGDYTGRKWGSRCVAMIMLSGSILLTFTPFATSASGYFTYFMTAQTWYGFGVGGEYPMASASAAERSATTPELRHLRAQQVILVFSNQGMGNLINAVVILISMAMFDLTGPSSTVQSDATGAQSKTTLDPDASRNVLFVTYGFGAAACLVMVVYRNIFLEESARMDSLVKRGTAVGMRRHIVSLYYYWPRQWVASMAWVANDFAFYGNKLQQGIFLKILFSTSTPYQQQQWNVLNSFIALLGYYCAAALCDKPWYGRVRCQSIGFAAMFVFYIIIFAQWGNMGVPCDAGVVPPNCASTAGAQAFQALYYLSSFFNQFGPNATTWLVAGEIFPTDIRTTYHGFAACMGKLGAIIASIWISYIDSTNLTGWSQGSNPDKPGGVRMVFLISALWAIGGLLCTLIWLPDTTGLDLEELDRMQRCILEGRFSDYHGEALNPKHLSMWERWVLKWHLQYNPELDRIKFLTELQEHAAHAKGAVAEGADAQQHQRTADIEQTAQPTAV